MILSAFFTAALAFLAGLLLPCPAQAAETVTISSDTLWKNSVVVEGLVEVEKGATLLVLPGTTVRFATVKDEGDKPVARLVVRGTLIAQGTAEEPILFTSSAPRPAPGDWGGIHFDKSNERANRLRHCRIEYARDGIIGSYSLLIAEDTELAENLTGLTAFRGLSGGLYNGTIANNGKGVYYYQSSSFSIERSRISNSTEGGIVCAYGSSPTIRQNEISDNAPAGITCFQGASPLIEGNTIRGSEKGVHAELKSRPKIYSNDIIENGTGVWAVKLSFPQIANNLIARNGTGIYCNYSGYPEIHGNDIVDNERFGLVLGDNMSIVMEKQIPFRSKGSFSFETSSEEPQFYPPKTRRFTPFTASDKGIVDARGNWWGPAALAEMAGLGADGNISVIEDAHDKPDTWYQEKSYPRDRVVFEEWEKGPVAGAGRTESDPAGIAGKVSHGGAPLPGIRVHLFRGADEDFRGEGFTYSAPAGKDGSFSLNVGPGSYFLVAKGPDPPFPHTEPGEGEYFGYYGGNPVTVESGRYTENNLQVVRRAGRETTAVEGQEGAVLEGVITGPDEAAEAALLHVYTDASRQFRGPGLFGPQGAVIGGTDTAGRFSVDLPQGKYYLVASRRSDGSFLGPLKPGDLHGFYDGNPVELSTGSRTTVTIRMVEKLRDTNRGPVTGGERTGIRGTIRDPAGNVPQDVYAYATTDPSFMIGAMPPFRSRPVGADGSFSIDLPGGGTYYVGARSGYGGPPLPGEWHGFLGGEAPRPVEVEEGKVTGGVSFTVRKME